MRVAVSGVGGGVGQSVLKALQLATLPLEVFPVDVQPMSAGLWRSRNSLILPRPELDGSEYAWCETLLRHKIDAVIPGSDHDLPGLSRMRRLVADKTGAQILVSDPDLVTICNDKAITVQTMSKYGLPVPRSLWSTTIEEARAWCAAVGYPVVLKPRDGFASRHVHVVRDDEELAFFFPRTPNPIVQEYLNLHGRVEEFTCAVFVDASGDVTGTFMARRDLTGGATYRAEVGHWPQIHELLVATGRALRPRGPMNVQLRLTERGPVPFELNLRCSGTTGIRAYFGFNEPEMLLRHYLLGEQLEPVRSRTGVALRYWNEVFLDDISTDELAGAVGSIVGKVIAWP